MSITTIQIGGNDYISYASVAEADAYLAVDPTRGPTWLALTADQKGTNLVSSTRQLDTFNYKGEKTGGSVQPNQWPRTGLTYPDGTAVPTDEVPLDIQNATILLAGSIAVDVNNSTSQTTASNTKRVRAGSAEVEFFRPTTGVPLGDADAHALISFWLAAAAAILQFGTTRATGTNSSDVFSDAEAPGLTEGYP